MLADGMGGCGSITSEMISLITMSIMALEAVKFCLLFKSLHLYIFFLPLFTLENEECCRIIVIVCFLNNSGT
jgi:hypothetical protein